MILIKMFFHPVLQHVCKSIFERFRISLPRCAAGVRPCSTGSANDVSWDRALGFSALPSFS